jgi:MFS family permease
MRQRVVRRLGLVVALMLCRCAPLARAHRDHLGLLACATTFVHSAMQFYIVRFLLGVAEAGLFPGVIYYLSDWFPLSLANIPAP